MKNVGILLNNNIFKKRLKIIIVSLSRKKYLVFAFNQYKKINFKKTFKANLRNISIDSKNYPGTQ